MNLACNTCFMDTVDDGVCRSCGAEQTEGHRDRRALAAGTDIGGKYTVGKVLGAGGFGITYLAQDVSLKRRVALKEFFPVGLVARGPDRMSVTCNSPNDEAPFERGLKRFFGEGQILARFNHPNIVRVFEVFRANGTAYLAMEFLDGKTLKDWITLNGRLETEQALQVMGFVLDALRAVHATHVVHRDVKPDNIYLTQQGRTLLLDFGGAKQLTAEGDRSMDAMFAHGYAAPEQYYADSGKIGPWTDVYACGATLYKMLTGQTMRGALDRYSEDPPLAWLRVTVAETIRAAVVKAVVLKHAERYQSIEEFQSAIHARAGVRAEFKVEANTEDKAKEDDEVKVAAQRLSAKRRQRLVVGFGLAAVGLAGAAWHLTGSEPPIADRPPTAPDYRPPPVAETPIVIPPVTITPTSRPTTTAAPSTVDARLNDMIEAADAQDWRRVAEAVKAIRKAVGDKAKVSTNHTSLLIANGEEAIERQDYGAATSSLTGATAQDAGDWRAWSALGYASLRLGRRAEAKRALTTGLRLKPDDSSAWVHLGELLALEDNPAVSAATLRLAIYFSAHRDRALALLRDSERNLMAPEFQAIIRAEGNTLDQLPPRKP